MDGTGASEDVHDNEHVNPLSTGGQNSLSEADGFTGEASQTAIVSSTHGGSGETVVDTIAVEGDLGGAHTTHGLESSRQDLHEDFFQPPTRSMFDDSIDGDLGGAHGETWGFQSSMVDDSLSSPSRGGLVENSIGIADNTVEASRIAEVTSTHGGSGEARLTVIDSIVVEGDLGGAHTTHGLESSRQDLHEDFFQPPTRSMFDDSVDGDLGGAHGETWGFQSSMVGDSLSSPSRGGLLENSLGIAEDTGEASQTATVTSTHGGSGEARPTVMDTIVVEGDLGGAHTTHGLESSRQDTHEDFFQPPARSMFDDNVDGDLGGAHGETWGFQSSMVGDSLSSPTRGDLLENGIVGDLGGAYVASRPDVVMTRSPEVNSNGTMSAQFCGDIGGSLSLPSADNSPAPGGSGSNLVTSSSDDPGSTQIPMVTSSSDDPGSTPTQNANNNNTNMSEDPGGTALAESVETVGHTPEIVFEEFREHVPTAGQDNNFFNTDFSTGHSIQASRDPLPDTLEPTVVDEEDDEFVFDDVNTASHSSVLGAPQLQSGGDQFDDPGSTPTQIANSCTGQTPAVETAFEAPKHGESNAGQDDNVFNADFSSVPVPQASDDSFSNVTQPQVIDGMDDDLDFANFTGASQPTVEAPLHSSVNPVGIDPIGKDVDEFGFADFSAASHSSVHIAPESKIRDFEDPGSTPTQTEPIQKVEENDDFGFDDFKAPPQSVVTAPVLAAPQLQVADDHFDDPGSTPTQDRPAVESAFEAPKIGESNAGQDDNSFNADFSSVPVPQASRDPLSNTLQPADDKEDGDFFLADFNTASHSSVLAAPQLQSGDDHFDDPGSTPTQDRDSSTGQTPAVESAFEAPKNGVSNAGQDDLFFNADFSSVPVPQASNDSFPNVTQPEAVDGIDDVSGFASFPVDPSVNPIGKHPDDNDEDDFGFADFGEPPQSSVPVVSKIDENDVEDPGSTPIQNGNVEDMGFADFGEPPQSSVPGVSKIDDHDVEDPGSTPTQNGNVEDTAKTEHIQKVEEDDDFGFDDDFKGASQSVVTASQVEEEDDDFGFDDFKGASQSSVTAPQAEEDDDFGFDDFKGASQSSVPAPPVQDDDYDFDDFSRAPAFAKTSATENDGDDDFDDFSSAPTPAKDTTPNRQPTVASTSSEAMSGPSITAEAIVERWCQAARKCAPCRDVFQYLPDGCSSESQSSSASWQDWLSSCGSSLPLEAKELLSSGVSAQVVPIIPSTGLGLNAAGAQASSLHKSQIREVFFSTLGKHLQLPPPKGFETMDPSKESPAITGMEIETDGIDRGSPPLPLEADVSSAFPTMSPGRGTSVVTPAFQEAPVSKNLGNSSSAFGDDWGMFANSGPTVATTTSTSSGFDDPFGSFASSAPSQPVASSIQSTGGDLLSQTLGEFGLQTTAPAPGNTSTQFSFPGVTSDSSLLGDAIVRSNDYPPRVKSFLESLPDLSHLYSSTIVC